MIVTVTLNPAIDLTLSVSHLAVNEVNRSSSLRRDPAGKGINVSRALVAQGVDTVAVFPGDADSGSWIERALNAEGVETIRYEVPLETRTNVVITDDTGNTTTINGSGANISTADMGGIISVISSSLAVKPSWLVLAGSLPHGVDSSTYVGLAAEARNLGVRVAVDTSGPALAAVAHAGVADMMKPNHKELEELAGRPLPLVADVVDFVRGLLANEHACVVTSLGPHGAILVSQNDVLWAHHAPVPVKNTVGAGDCTLAGFLAGDRLCRSKDIGGREGNTLRLTTAVAWGTAKVQLPGTTMPGTDLIASTQVMSTDELDLGTRIEDL